MHLPSGAGKEPCEQRNTAFNDVIKGAARDFSSRGLPVALEQHTTFCFGDLNYRLTAPNREARWRMGCRDWQTLLCADQLLNQLGAEGTTYQAWDEADITFRPTYKYDVGTVDRFDSSEKARAPAWCDRVLWREQGAPCTISPLLYDSCMTVVRSDHKPIKFLARVAPKMY